MYKFIRFILIVVMDSPEFEVFVLASGDYKVTTVWQKLYLFDVVGMSSLNCEYWPLLILNVIHFPARFIRTTNKLSSAY